MKVTKEYQFNEFAFVVTIPETGDPKVTTRGHVKVEVPEQDEPALVGINHELPISDAVKQAIAELKAALMADHAEHITNNVERDISITQMTMPSNAS